jgi:hypothetical protein
LKLDFVFVFVLNKHLKNTASYSRNFLSFKKRYPYLYAT